MRTLHLTDWGRVLLEKLIVICMVQKLPVFSRTKIYCCITILNPYSYGTTAPSSPGPPPCWGFTIKLRPTTLSTTPLDGCLVRLRDLYLRTHNTLKGTVIHATRGIRVHNSSKQKAADPCLWLHATEIGSSVLCQMNQVHILPCCVFKTSLTIALPSIPTSSKWFLPFRVPN